MKKYFFLLVCTLCILSCSNDNEDNSLPVLDKIVGEWVYDHIEDEGIWETQKFVSSGVFYYSNISTGGWKFSNDTKDGRYWVDGGNRITCSCTMEGVSVTFKMTIIDITDYSYTAEYNDGAALGTFTFARLIDKQRIKPGQKVTPDYGQLVHATILGYKSHKMNVATVDSSSGEITAVASGHTYIDVITDQGTAVVEVISFDEDNMFEDYSFALTKTIPEIVEHEGNKYEYRDDEMALVYVVDHFLVDTVTYMTGINDRTHVEYVQLTLNDNVSAAQIKKHLAEKNAVIQVTETTSSYVTGQKVGRLPVALLYDETRSTLSFFLLKPSDLWTDYISFLGLTPAEVKNRYGEPYYEDSETIYFVEENDYIDMVAFSISFVTDKVYAASAFLKVTADYQGALDYLNNKYYYYEKGSDPTDNYFAFTDKKTLDESNVGITFHGGDGCITYIDLKAERRSQAKERSMQSDSYKVLLKRLHRN
ncbi:hypothetical protein [Phocaeicola sp.]